MDWWPKGWAWLGARPSDTHGLLVFPLGNLPQAGTPRCNLVFTDFSCLRGSSLSRLHMEGPPWKCSPSVLPRLTQPSSQKRAK